MRALLILLCLVGIGAGAYFYFSRDIGAVVWPTNNPPPPPQASPPSYPGASPAVTPHREENPSNPPVTIAPAAPSEIDAAKADVAQKSYALEQAKAAVLVTLKNQADYRSAQADVADLQSQVDTARAANSPELSFLSTKWIAAKNKVAEMESNAYDTSEIQSAQRQLTTAKAHLSELEARANTPRKSTAIPTH